MASKIVPFSLATDLVGGGSVSVAYPAGTSKGNFSGSLKHKLATSAGNVFGSPQYFTLTFNATTVQVNWTSGSPTIPTGTQVFLELDEPGKSASVSKSPFPELFNVVRGGLMMLNFGSPQTADDDGVALAQAVASANDLTLAGALVVAGVAVFDVARTLQYVSSNAGDTTQTVTTYGYDDYGVAMLETVTLNGTTIVQGVKAFKRVTRQAVSAACAGNVKTGTSTKLGFPILLPSTAYVLKEIVNAAGVTNGTYVVGSTAKPSATTDDVRGLYVPNSAPNGTNTYEIVMAAADPDQLGQAQFAG